MSLQFMWLTNKTNVGLLCKQSHDSVFILMYILELTLVPKQFIYLLAN